MKLNFGKKLLLFAHWLFSLAACALAVILCVWPERAAGFFSSMHALMGKTESDVLGIALLVVYLLLSAGVVLLIFSDARNRGERGFITVDSSDAGRTRIAIGAVAQMIRQATRGVEGIAEMKTRIESGQDAINISADVTIQAGAHVPTVTMNIQRAIRSYIELNCGVAVREVCVNVHALEAGAESGRRGRRGNSESPAPAWQPPAAEAPQSAPVMEAAEPEAEIEAQAEVAEAPAEAPVEFAQGEADAAEASKEEE